MQGEKYNIIMIPVEQVRMDQDAVKRILSAEQLPSVYKTITFTQIKTALKDPSKKKPFKLPNLSNVTLGGIIDMLGDVRQQISELKKLDGIYVETLQARIKERDELLKAEKKRGKADA